MNVDAYGATAAMQMQAQMQMRKMDGSGSGQGMGQGGMKAMMQSLSPEERTALQEQMNAMNPQERSAAIAQMRQIDAASMQSDTYFQSLLDILNQERQTNSTSSSTAYNFSVYA